MLKGKNDGESKRFINFEIESRKKTSNEISVIDKEIAKIQGIIKGEEGQNKL